MNFNTLVESILNESKHSIEVLGISDIEKNKKGKILVTFYDMKVDGLEVEFSDSHEPGRYRLLGDYYFVGPEARIMIDKYSDKEYDEIKKEAKKAVEVWKLKQKLSSSTKETFGDLIDEL